MTSSVHIVGSDNAIKAMYERRGYNIVDSIGSAQIIQFIGGADINPQLYGENRLIGTSVNHVSDQRDLKAWRESNPKSLRIGICRGGQILNVVNGGWMWQHVSGHAQDHEINDVLFGKKVKVTSTHHQMMIPNFEAGAEVLAFADKISYNHKSANFDRKPPDYDTEVVYYERTNSLCFQPHPEYGETECEEYFFDLIEMFKP